MKWMNYWKKTLDNGLWITWLNFKQKIYDIFWYDYALARSIVQEITYASELLFLRVVLIKDEPAMFVLIKNFVRFKTTLFLNVLPKEERRTQTYTYRWKDEMQA